MNSALELSCVALEFTFINICMWSSGLLSYHQFNQLLSVAYLSLRCSYGDGDRLVLRFQNDSRTVPLTYTS